MMGLISHGRMDAVNGYFYKLLPMREALFDLRDYKDYTSTGGEGVVTSFGTAHSIDDFVVEGLEMDTVWLSACPKSKAHRTDGYFVDMEVDIISGVRPSPVVPIEGGGDITVSDDLRVALSAVPLKGIGFRRVDRIKQVGRRLTAAEVDEDKRFHLWHLVPTAPCVAVTIVSVTPEIENRCVHCGFAPIVCLDCGYFERPCPHCGQTAVVGEREAGHSEARLVIAAKCLVTRVAVAHWNGADYFNGIVTRRVLDLLLSVHAYPFVAVPVAADLQGASARQRDLLAESIEQLEIRDPP